MGVMRALQGLGLADIWGTSRIPLYVLNVTYPFGAGRGRWLLPRQAGRAAGRGGAADYIEQALSKILCQAAIPTVLAGKDPFPMAGEYTAAVMAEPSARSRGNGSRTSWHRRCRASNAAHPRRRSM